MAVQNYTITATAHWAIVWTGLGQQGTIEMDLTAQAHTKVVEVSAVNIPNDKHGVPTTPSLPPGPTGVPTKKRPLPHQPQQTRLLTTPHVDSMRCGAGRWRGKARCGDWEAYSWGVGEDESGDGLYCGFEGVVGAAVIGV